MIEVQDHLSGCLVCSEEYRAFREVVVLLRTMAVRDSGPVFEDRIRQTIDAERVFSPGSLNVAAVLTPQRVRRLASAVALSCVGILTVALRLGSATLQTATARGSFGSQALSLSFQTRFPGTILTGVAAADLPGNLAATIPGPPSHTGSMSHQQSPSRFLSPLDNWDGPFMAPAGGYTQSNVSFTAYTH